MFSWPTTSATASSTCRASCSVWLKCVPSGARIRKRNSPASNVGKISTPSRWPPIQTTAPQTARYTANTAQRSRTVRPVTDSNRRRNQPNKPGRDSACPGCRFNSQAASTGTKVLDSR